LISTSAPPSTYVIDILLYLPKGLHNIIHVLTGPKEHLMPQQYRARAGLLCFGAFRRAEIHNLPVSFQDLGAEVFGQMLHLKDRVAVKRPAVTRDKGDAFCIEGLAEPVRIKVPEMIGVIAKNIIVITMFHGGCLFANMSDARDLVKALCEA
jgi:hypothetical protein